VSERMETRELLAYLDRVERGLDKLTYFELLDIAGDAGDRAITDSFHRLAGRIHPDRYRQALAPADLDRLTTVYARIAHAYTELRDPARRKRYVEEMTRAAPAAGATPAPAAGDADAALSLLSPKAQRLYRRAEAALRGGDAASAILNLRMALASDRGSELLREALADAEARQKKG